MKENKIKEIILETYKLLFAASTPSVDFDELCKNCKYEDYDGKQVETSGYLTDEELHTMHLKRSIPFMDYEIEKEKAEQIVCEQVKKYKLNKFDANCFRANIWLGCSPKFKN